jgi:transcriptional regulator with XRE-family HTH domain
MYVNKNSCFRLENKLTQPELAYKLDISQTTLSEIKSGKTKIVDFLLMNKVCEVFYAEFDYFLDDKTTNNLKKVENYNIGCTSGTINNTIPEGILENMLKRIEILESKYK